MLRTTPQNETWQKYESMPVHRGNMHHMLFCWDKLRSITRTSACRARRASVWSPKPGLHPKNGSAPLLGSPWYRHFIFPEPPAVATQPTTTINHHTTLSPLERAKSASRWGDWPSCNARYAQLGFSNHFAVELTPKFTCRKNLEHLMGAEAMGIIQVDLKFTDPKVCRSYLCGACPHDLFTNTVQSLFLFSPANSLVSHQVLTSILPFPSAFYTSVNYFLSIINSLSDQVGGTFVVASWSLSKTSKTNCCTCLTCLSTQIK
ncbi:hypothetical protein VP01_195g4 [Puccinia sorghi]|uniref:Uncharacterized protein n=1 Tax=Puccinia sorghi TaxID=27349 RepID=A0A0L6VC27_9BASI|nr:hypothetical protein VP01_195g4 [Puccinia sorghi]